MMIEVCQLFGIIPLMPLPAYVKYIFFSALLILAAVNFTRTTLNIIQRSKRLDELREEVASLESEKVNIKKDLEYRNSTDYIEKEARNKLSLVRPGEHIYISPLALSNMDDGEVLGSKGGEYKSNLELWLELFL
jgi:cell division protein FtsB